MRCMMKLKRLGLLLILILISNFITITVAHADYISEKKHVLFLSSYHEGFTWAEEVTDGVLSVLKNSDYILDISVEYMDWKNYPTDENLNYLLSHYQNKYENRKIDVIIASDDAALDFALKNRDRLFSNAPVVFCGVNEVGVADIVAGEKNVTGILEQVDPGDTIKLAIEAMPELETIYLVYDNTESGYSSGQIAYNALKRIRPDIEGISINNMTYEEVFSAIKNVKKNSAVFIVSFYTDTAGNSLSFEKICEIASQVSNVPVFDLYDFTVGHGAIGGSMLSGKMQGENAARMTLRILGGEAAQDIPISHEKTVRELYDYNQLVRFNIPLSRINPESEIINKPFSFFETYQTLVLIVVGVILILTVFIALLVMYIRKLKIAEKDLKQSHDTLTQLLGDLTASEQEIKKQWEELAVSQEKLKESEARHRLVLEGSNDMIWDVDLVARKEYFSDRWIDLVGYENNSEAAYSKWTELLHPDDINRVKRSSVDHLKGKTPYYRCEYRLMCQNGEHKWFLSRGKALFNKEGRAIRFAGSLADIDDSKIAEIKLNENYQELEATYEELFATQAELNSKYEEMKDYQEKLHQNAYHDAMTGLPNRLSLYETWEAFFKKSPEGLSAFLYIDSDNFKFINDTMGHSFGDLFITEIGKRLSTLLRDNQLLYRLGGDEFIICDCASKDVKAIEGFAADIIHSFNTPFVIADSILYVTVSIGISIYSEHGNSVDALMQHADIAMYRAKSLGKNKYFIYNHDLQTIVKERMDIEKNLRSALKNNEFSLNYQPQLDIRTGEISGFEALLRWTNPELGSVPPLRFIGIAEETHLIIAIGDWVLRKSCEFLKEFYMRGHTKLTIAVNVSILQLLQENFVDSVLETVQSVGLEPSCLELEITESILMQSYQVIRDKLLQLKEAGIKIALDDFGQGYSSLSYLKQLPINTLKIDKCFIDSINSKNPKDNFIDTIIMIGHKMGLVVLAEGVENKEQMDYLIKHKCHMAQGYLISRPVPEEKAAEFFQEWNQL